VHLNLSVCLSDCQSLFLSTFLPAYIYLSYLSVCLSTNVFIYLLSVYLSIWLSVLICFMSACASVCPFVHQSVGLSICPSVRRSVHLSIRPSVCPSVHLSIFLYLFNFANVWRALPHLCLSVSLSFYLPVGLLYLSTSRSYYLSLYLSVCLSLQKTMVYNKSHN
jgi:hypothetical protein